MDWTAVGQRRSRKAADLSGKGGEWTGRKRERERRDVGEGSLGRGWGRLRQEKQHYDWRRR